jgi:hypothetical protein
VQDLESKSRTSAVAEGFFLDTYGILLCSSRTYELVFYYGPEYNGTMELVMTSETLASTSDFQVVPEFSAQLYFTTTSFLNDEVIFDGFVETEAPEESPNEEEDVNTSDPNDIATANDFQISRFLPQIIGGSLAGLLVIIAVLYFVVKGNKKRRPTNPAQAAVGGVPVQQYCMDPNQMPFPYTGGPMTPGYPVGYQPHTLPYSVGAPGYANMYPTAWIQNPDGSQTPVPAGMYTASTTVIPPTEMYTASIITPTEVFTASTTPADTAAAANLHPETAIPMEQTPAAAAQQQGSVELTTNSPGENVEGPQQQ